MGGGVMGGGDGGRRWAEMCVRVHGTYMHVHIADAYTYRRVRVYVHVCAYQYAFKYRDVYMRDGGRLQI